METLFAIILTSCVLGADNNVYCEPFQIKLYETKSLCESNLPKYRATQEEFEKYDCYPVQYEKDHGQHKA